MEAAAREAFQVENVTLEICTEDLNCPSNFASKGRQHQILAKLKTTSFFLKFKLSISELEKPYLHDYGLTFHRKDNGTI